ncbi:unnamed protein product, partial [Prunus brigantina]
GGLRRQHVGQSSSASRSHQKPHRSLQHAQNISHEVEFRQVHIWSLMWLIFGILSHPKGYQGSPQSNQWHPQHEVTCHNERNTKPQRQSSRT